MDKVYQRFSLQGHLLITGVCSNVPGIFGSSLHDRSTISNFSASSRARMRRYLRCSVAEYRNMVTLTYPFTYPKDGRVFKEHLRRFVQECKRFTERELGSKQVEQYSIFWFLEFQRRGAAHFHLFTTHNYPKDWIASTWFRIVGSEDERHLRAGTRIEKIRSGRRGISAYATKYAAKMDQKEAPDWVVNAGRFWGVSGLRRSVAADILLDVREPRSMETKRRLKNLKTTLDHGISDGSVMFSSKGDQKIYYLKNNSDVAAIKSHLMFIAIAHSVDYPTGMVHMPEHETEEEQWY